MDRKVIEEMTGLTTEDLLSLLIEAGFGLTEAYTITGRTNYQDLACRLSAAREFLLKHYVSSVKPKKMRGVLQEVN